MRRRLQLRLHQHDLVAHADDAAADGEQSARGVRAAVRRQRQHRPRRRGWRGSRTIAASSTRSSRKCSGCGARLGPADTRQADGVPRRGARHRAADPEGRGAERRRAAVDGAAERRHPGDLRRAREADVRSAGAGVPDRHDPRHHLHDGARSEPADLSRDRRRRIRTTRCRTTRTTPRRWRSWRRSTRTTSSSSPISWRSCRRRRTATARCSIT